MTPLLLETSGSARQLVEEAAIRITDHFILRYRLPGSSTVVDRFVAGREDLTAADPGDGARLAGPGQGPPGCPVRTSESLHGHRYAIDAMLAATAHTEHGDVPVITSDTDDLRRLCHTHIAVEPI
ncbi:hypothetical protein OG909_16040 [Streptomyces sp. NBC_01754]|uniref:hypothetical protein n=1 Tax=Streptomyces sp. NBC_01754 TaxID=2975930 RepID=UPI002DD88592|nr:hypothetical protein [Streptomyces sp. NBC_01754]WSC93672.1 hypothetical protein OG909_16040 [Streptomyces sp. NBC_01754]